MTGDVKMSVRSALLLIHESPVVYTDCMVMLNDIKYLDQILGYFDNVTQLDMYLQMFDNVMFNLADIIYNLIEARNNIINSKFNALGINVGQIMSDIFLKNPIDESVWSDAHSEIVIDEINPASQKVNSTFFSEIEVSSTEHKSPVETLKGIVEDVFSSKAALFNKEMHKKYSESNNRQPFLKS